MKVLRTLFFPLVLAVMLGGCSGDYAESSRHASHSVTGTVQVPAQFLAALPKPKPSLLARLLSVVSTTGWADISGSVGGFVPVAGVTVELIRLNFDPVTELFYETVVGCDGGCPVTAADGSFTIITTESASSTLALKVTFVDPVDGTPDVVMRAMVYGDNVDVTPISEAAAQIVIASLNQFVLIDNFTVNEVGALVNLIEDEDIDITGLNFPDAITKIKTDASDILARFIVGFQEGGEMNVANANDIWHIVELRNRLIAPNISFPNGAVNFQSTLGGAVSFDNNGDFQIGSALYYWGLRSDFFADPVRLFDQALNELDYDPLAPAYEGYKAFGLPVGFRGISAASNGMAVANSNTEATTYGFLTNDGGMVALLSEKNDEVQSIYDRGLRILMRKWRSSSDAFNTAFDFTNNTFNYADGIDSKNSSANVQNSIDLNPLMHQSTYNVIMYQHYLNNSGIEIGAGTGQWLFDTESQIVPADNSDVHTTTPYGFVDASNLNLDTAKYLFSIGFVSRNAAKTMEPCPNYFAIEDGGSLLLRRDITNNDCNGVAGENIFAGAGAVSADGEVFVVPQTFDDSEDNLQLAYSMPVGAPARRGWYIGIKRQANLTNAHLQGIYHVVGQVTEVDGGPDTVTYQTFHGSLQFTGVDDGLGNMRVEGTLHRKSAMLDDIDNDATPPLLSRTQSIREAVSGTYRAAPDGTVAFSLPGYATTGTETVTGAAGQVVPLADGNELAMFLAIPINRNASGKGARGIMLLAHEFIIEYPVPPDPPGPPRPPDDLPPLPPG
jgi:hypothetical protein